MPNDAGATGNTIAAPRGRSVLLGVFILAQLVFLFVNNLLSLVEHAHGPNRKYIPDEMEPVIEQIAPREKPGQDHFWTLLGTVNRAADAWSDVTGQPQMWSLFSNPDGVSDFPAVQVRWDEPAAAYPLEKTKEPKPVLSENEPADIDEYVRIGNFRLRRLESFIVPELAEHETREKWNTEIADHVRRNQALIRTYLRWRVSSEWENRRPLQVILLQRRYVARAPGDDAAPQWHGPRIIPLARWQPRAGKNAALEAYNLVTERFEPVRK